MKGPPKGLARVRARAGQAGEEGAGLGHEDLGAAELPVVGGLDPPSERPGHRLHAVADPEDGDTEFIDARVGSGGALIVDAGRAAGEHDPGWVELSNGVQRSIVGVDFAVDVQLADAAGDELRVLGAEVENQDGVGGGHGALTRGSSWGLLP